jgi:hypothetical protein
MKVREGNAEAQSGDPLQRLILPGTLPSQNDQLDRLPLKARITEAAISLEEKGPCTSN